MSQNHDAHRPSNAEGGLLTSRAGIGLLVFLAIGGFLLLTEHRAHVLGAALFLLLLACPLLHVFMHGDHGGNNNQSSRPQREQDRIGT